MKWMKQVFAQRYNREEGRIGHVWVDRYGSRIVEGEPTGEDAWDGGRTYPAALPHRVRPHWGERSAKTVFFLISSPATAPDPG
jgi:hypothetical protein